MAIVQISRITQRKGLRQDLPDLPGDPLAGGELGWCTDTRQLFIGNGTLAEGAPVVGNTEILTAFSDILGFSTAYTYKGLQAGYTVQDTVSQSLQSRLDSNAIITDFGVTGDGVTDVTDAINNALNQLFCQADQTSNVNATRRSLYFPAGTYIISNTLNIPPFCNLYGDGPESTVISFYLQTWNVNTAYGAGVLVKNGSSYYRSKIAVPIGTLLTNTAYWDNTATLPDYIFRTADSNQNTGVNIGTGTGVFKPGSLEISRMKFQTNCAINGAYIEAAHDCSFESVNISGPSSLDLTTSTANIAAVSFNSTLAQNCTNIEWNHCTFSYMTWGVNTNEQIEGVTFSNCAFNNLYQGVYLGSSPAPAVGPTGFRIIANTFDSIYAQGIVFLNVGMNCSAYNAFYDVGNYFSPLDPPTAATSIIDIDGLNNVSVGDMFERTNSGSAGLVPRIALNNLNGIAIGMNVNNVVFYQNGTAPGVPYNYANQMAVGTYQRMSGITDTLIDNSSSSKTLLTFNATYIRAVKIDYTIVRGTAVRTGTYTIVSGTDASGTGLAGSDSGVQNSSPGVTFSQSESSSVVSWTYTTTNTGSDGTIYYSVTKLA